MMTGEQFKAARKRLGLSQTALADKWGITRQSIINWERDGPPLMAQDAIRYRELSIATGQAMAILDKCKRNQDEKTNYPYPHSEEETSSVPDGAIAILIHKKNGRGMYIRKLCHEDNKNYHALLVGEDARPVPTYSKREYKLVPIG